jgi:hypothetical protein
VRAFFRCSAPFARSSPGAIPIGSRDGRRRSDRVACRHPAVGVDHGTGSAGSQEPHSAYSDSRATISVALKPLPLRLGSSLRSTLCGQSERRASEIGISPRTRWRLSDDDDAVFRTNSVRLRRYATRHTTRTTSSIWHHALIDSNAARSYYTLSRRTRVWGNAQVTRLHAGC